uniref:Putative tail collar domain protein n=1 Tax=viral metagenome TaxID=1070528 RepID=A0A6M3IWC1_9ZZZZ
MVETWDVTSPAGTQAVSLGDDRIRELKRALVERLTVDHQIVTDETGLTNIGYHKQITLIEAANIGAGATGIPILGAQTVSGKPELTFTSEDDSDVQMTDSDTTLGCKILGDNVRLKNNTNLTAKNAAGAAAVNILKVNASDIIELASFPITPSAAPDADYEVANKKYVDDQAVSTLQVVGTSDITPASTSYVDMTNMSLTLTGAGVYIFTFDAPIKISSASAATVSIALDIDGADVVERVYGGHSINGENPVGKVCTHISWVVTITTETTAKIQWKYGVGDCNQYGSESKRVFSFMKIG